MLLTAGCRAALELPQLPCLQQNVHDGGPKACEINHVPSRSWCEADALAIKEHASQKIFHQAGTWAHAEPKVGTDSKRNSSSLVSLQNHPSTAQYGCPNGPAVLLLGRDEAACVPGTLQVPGRSACCLQTFIFGDDTPPKSLFAAVILWWCSTSLVVVAALGFGAILSNGHLGVPPCLAGARLFSPPHRGSGVSNPIKAALKATGYCFGLSARKLMKLSCPARIPHGGGARDVQSGQAVICC